MLLGSSSHYRRSSYNMEYGKLRKNSVEIGDIDVNSFLKYMYIHDYVHMCICMYVYACVCVCMCLHMCRYMFLLPRTVC